MESMLVDDGSRGNRLARVRNYATAAALALAGNLWIVGAGPAAASVAPLTLQYTCPFPLIGSQPVTASLVWSASDTHVVGQATPRLPVSVSATVSPAVRQALNFDGAASVEGTAEVGAVVVAPQGHIGVTVPLAIPRTGVPTSGSLTVPARGTAPSLVFSAAGSAQITLGPFALHLSLKDASGGLALVGHVDTSCTLNSGQNDVLASFQILPPATRPTPSPARPSASGPPASPTVGPSGSAPARVTVPVRVTVPATSTSANSGPVDTAGGVATGASTLTSTPNGEPASDSSSAGSLFKAVGVLVVCAAAFGAWWWFKRRSRGEGGSA